MLLDLTPMFPAPKIIPPEADQLPNESKKFWADVTRAIVDKQFGQATKLKRELEERQRQKATDRKEKDEQWSPRFFTAAVTPAGRPDLTDEGRAALKGLHEENYKLEESSILGA